MKREIMMFIKEVTKEKETSQNWVILEPYFNENLDLAGFKGYLETENGGIQIGDRVCLHNDSMPGSINPVMGTLVIETPFHYVIEVEVPGAESPYRRCINKSALFSSYTLEKEVAKKEKIKEYEKKMKEMNLLIPAKILEELAEEQAIIDKPTREIVEKINKK